jgi:SAM-dependent methyltransferase
VAEDRVRTAYETFATIYNDFNHLNDYEMWLGRALLPELEKHGLRHGRVLDVACGTGRAFEPLLRRGWEIVGCDLSPAMLARAERESAGRVELSQADMRELPDFGEFDLVLALNDPANYMFDRDQLERALAGMRANLARHGLVIFDCNSKSTFETTYTSEVREVEHEGRRWTWRAMGQIDGDPYLFENVIEGDDVEPIAHRERFWPESEVREAMAAAGLDCLSVLGMWERDGEVILTDPPDEDQHYKVVYIGAKHPRQPAERD